jgi:alpha-glucosidase
MKHAFYLLFLISCSLAACFTFPGKQVNLVRSPDTEVKLRFGLNEEGSPYYLLFYRGERVIDTSYLGFRLYSKEDMYTGFRLLSIEESTLDETWEQPWGEERLIRNHYQEMTVHLQEKANFKRKLDVVFRVFDDGIGFRYVFPGQDHIRNIEIEEELTEFNLSDDATAWWIPAFEENRYEYLYTESPVSSVSKVHTPITLKTNGGHYLSIHEAALENYSSMVLRREDSTRLVCELVPYSVEDTAKAFVNGSGRTPWRTIQLAQRPGDLITSYLILNLNEPNRLGDVSWFHPGKYVGIWWEMHVGKSTWGSGDKHGATTENTKEYIDFAAENGFDGVLVEGWNTGWDSDWTKNGYEFNFVECHPSFDREYLADYAKRNDVYLVGHHETGGFVDNYEAQLSEAFEVLDKYGYQAVKTGYVEHGNVLGNGKYHHGQAFINHYHNVIKLAAQHQIAVVAHEPIKPTGERRTYPNMISSEGARGQEFNAWSPDGGNPPDHTTILPFTRCLGGPMDFTPGVFDLTLPSKPDNQVNTTLAKQLALYVVIYSPMQMACDLPENYLKYPDAFQFIKDVAVDWESTRVLGGEIGDFITVARKERDTDKWFVGAITDEQAREVRIPLVFLDADREYEARIYHDAPDADYRTNPEAYTIENKLTKATDVITLRLAPGGGAALSFKPINNETKIIEQK